jgi:uncharacterized damage-inducible protein DinB
MALTVELSDLIAYTDWQREKWLAFLSKHEVILHCSAGPHGDGRFTSIGDVVKHIFSAEKRYVDRLSHRPLTDPAPIPNDDVEGLFRFGAQSRRELREFINSLPATAWDVTEEHKIVGHKVRLLPRKVAIHIILHEIRHWAQIATLVRLIGKSSDLQDFLVSPVLNDPHVEIG